MGDFYTAQFPVAVLQVVNEAGIFPAGPVIPDSPYVPAGYTGPRVVYGAQGGPLLFIGAPSGATVTMPTSTELKTGDLLLAFLIGDNLATLAVTASPGRTGTVLNNQGFSNGNMSCASIVYTAGDGGTTFTVTGHTIYWVVQMVLRGAGGTVTLDQKSLANAATVTNYGFISGQLAVTKPQSCYIAYATEFGAASAAANNLFGELSGGFGGGTSGLLPDTLSYLTVFNTGGSAAGPLFVGAGYSTTIPSATGLSPGLSPILTLPRNGVNGGAGNQPFGLLNFY